MPELICTADDRAAWLAARSSGVTAADIVTILGLSSYDSPYGLFWRKMGQVPDQPDNDRMRLGRELEPFVIRRWLEARDLPVPAEGPMIPNELYRSTARPWQMATIDAQLDGEPVEVKTWADADKGSWSPSGPFQGPPRVRAQVLWQMDVMDAATGHVGVMFLPSGEFRRYTIGSEWDDEMQRDIDLMRLAGHEFYRRLRMELPPPDPDSSAATLAAAKARFAKVPGKRGQVDPDLWLAWTECKGHADLLSREVRGLESLIREQLGDADEIEVDGQVVGKRIVGKQDIKAHTRRMDYIKRINGKAGNDE